MQWVECIPNFSEGRDPAKIQEITRVIEETEGVKLLDVDSGRDTNRTVVTFIGTPDATMEAAFKAIRRASEVLDMSGHHGEHPRMGATDVCPFVPVSGISMEECAALARNLGKRVGDDLKIPVYLYEEAASYPQRKNLADVRSGEYEGLPDKLKDPNWKPDFGPAKFNPKTGATAIGAREFLIAYNINLNTRDVRIAREIAFLIRETGRIKRDKDGTAIQDSEGNALREPGKFKAVKAVGWYMEAFGRAQISINFINYRITPPHLVFDECCRIALSMGARVTGSELVGLIPLESLLQAGRHYLKRMGKSTGVPEAELIHTAVLSLGLNDLYPFDKEKKIVEYNVQRPGRLVSMPVSAFTDLLSTGTPAPGGGSVAALCGALSGALTSMVAALTHGKSGYEDTFVEMEEIGTAAQKLKDAFLADVDRDSDAFDKVMAAMRLPKKTNEEKAARLSAIEKAAREATNIPLKVLRRSREAARLAHRAAVKGNRNSSSDAGMAALASRAAAEGAFLNVSINLKGLNEGPFKKETAKEANRLRKEVVQITKETLRFVEGTFEPSPRG